MERPVIRLCRAHGLRAAALTLSWALSLLAFADVPAPAATATLDSLGVSIDKATKEQLAYAESWEL